MRVALLGGGAELGAGLAARGHDVQVIAAPATPFDGLLRARGFADGLALVPAGRLALRRRPCDVAHAFTPGGAAAARATGRPVVFTCTELLDRGNVADRRLRLALLRTALEGSAAVLVPDEPRRAALERWMAVDAQVLAPGDAADHEALYGRLLAG